MFKTRVARLIYREAMDMVLHGWDIASATGQEYACPDDVAALVLATVEAQGELFRQYQRFAAVVPPPEGRPDAGVLDRALRLSGRDPRWQLPGR